MLSPLSNNHPHFLGQNAFNEIRKNASEFTSLLKKPVAWIKSTYIFEDGSRLPNESKAHFLATKVLEVVAKISYTFAYLAGGSILGASAVVVTAASLIPMAAISAVALPAIGIAELIKNHTSTEKVKTIATNVILNCALAIAIPGMISGGATFVVVAFPCVVTTAVSSLFFASFGLVIKNTNLFQKFLRPDCSIGKMGDSIGLAEVKNEIERIKDSKRDITGLSIVGLEEAIDDDMALSLWKSRPKALKITKRNPLGLQEQKFLNQYFHAVKIENVEEEYIPKKVVNHSISSNDPLTKLVTIQAKGEFIRDLKILGEAHLAKLAADSELKKLILDIKPLCVTFHNLEQSVFDLSSFELLLNDYDVSWNHGDPSKNEVDSSRVPSFAFSLKKDHHHRKIFN